MVSRYRDMALFIQICGYIAISPCIATAVTVRMSSVYLYVQLCRLYGKKTIVLLY